jgi:hypothetical protein
MHHSILPVALTVALASIAVTTAAGVGYPAAFSCSLQGLQSAPKPMHLAPAQNCAGRLCFFQCAIVPAGNISAANFRREKFGTFSLYKQLSGKLSDLPVCAAYGV